MSIIDDPSASELTPSKQHFIRDDHQRTSKKLTPAEALQNIYSYCAYQERAHREVKNKLFGFGLTSDQVDELLSKLITDGFVNEERFARTFTGGKFRMKQWGRLKIESELTGLGVSKNCIVRGLQEIDPNDYHHTLRVLLLKKSKTTNEADVFRKKEKLARYAIAKGYEPEMVWEILKEMFPAKKQKLL